MELTEEQAEPAVEETPADTTTRVRNILLWLIVAGARLPRSQP